uniref:Mitogen-activated protein kinase n=1 Tax=Mucochytrium quahogii TaxID=96639 RepID=A0A7S2SMW8_9STRA|mmetsp:Transcript_8408/g.15823  ORF Transcript_8408/g.15823 Transcript_8408/m.15823 type:complete len:583 (+) Transcript_8408:431-2179(+)
MDTVQMEGFLVKKGRSGRHWKRRYFYLDGTVLRYFRNPGDSKHRGEVHITRGTFVNECTSKPNGLQLSTNRQVLVVCAESYNRQQEWLHAFLRSIELAKMEKDRSIDGYVDGSNSTGSCQEEESKSSSGSALGGRAGNLFKRLKSRRRNSNTSESSGSGKQQRTRMFTDDSIDPELQDLMEEDFDEREGRSDSFRRKLLDDEGPPKFQRRPTYTFSTPATTFEVDTRYSFIRPIGTGAYGVVVSAKDKLSQEPVAIKKVTRAFEDLVDAKRILREIKLLRHFDHENIIHIKDLSPPRGYNDFEDIYIVSELMETDLHRVIYSKQNLTIDHIQYFIYQILRALKYIHSANVLHRDLKPSNLLLNSNCDLKVCDFGLARGLEDTKLELTEYVVTRWYRAPEIMLACREYTKAIDVWSVGCIFAELLARKPLFPGEDYIHQLQLITDVLGTPSEADMHFIKSEKAKRFMRNQPLRCKRKMSDLYPKASAECLDLLNRMLHFNPDKRITVQDALEHPYLATLHQPDDEPLCEHIFLFDDNKADDELRKRDIQDQILEEVLHFHPEDRERILYEASQSKNKSTVFDV